MLKNYLKITLRNIVRHKGYSFINIAGLAIGMACCLFIVLWVLDELSFDRFHEKADVLYWVEQDQDYSGEKFHVNVTPHPMGPALKEEIPDIVDATRYTGFGGVLLRYGEKAFFEDGIRAVDPSFLRMFTFPMLKGDPNTALDEPYSIVLTREIAEKYFGNKDPVGQMFSADNQYELTVTGVVEDIPLNSTLTPDMLVPYEFMRIVGRTNDEWASNAILTFVQLHEQSAVPVVNEKISALRARYVEIDARERDPDYTPDPNNRRTEFSLRLLMDAHLYQYFGYGMPMGNIRYVYIFSAIALFVLLIACINFMNLATARSTNRAKEVGLRKVVGAVKGQLVLQFYGESIIYAMIALVVALALVGLLLPAFNTLSGKELSLDWNSLRLILGLTGITVLTGIVAGSYPALFLSAFRPVAVLKGSGQSGTKRPLFRKVLVVVQFTLSIFLVIGTGVVYNQLKYMRDMNLGYDKERLVMIPVRGEIGQSYGTLKSELLQDARVLGVSGTGQKPSFIGSNSSGAEWDGKDPEMRVLIGYNPVDYDVVETMKIEMAEGRSFSEDFPGDLSGAFLVNEEVVKIMGVESAVGARFSFLGIEGRIIGVMKNFHYQPLRNEIEPIAFVLDPDSIRYILVRIQSGDIVSSLDTVREIWTRIIPQYPFDYTFLDEDFDSMYRTEERMGTLLNYFSVFAIIIACLGLFGLASFTAEQRTKEVGVRKVLGASAPQVTVLLGKEFLFLVVLSNLLAWPVAYMVMDNWLQNFAYRTDIGVDLFATAAALALVIAIITVSYHAIRSALSNPVDALRHE